MARFAKEFTVSAGSDTSIGGISGYTAAAGDKIIITPLDHGGHEGNVQLWLYWDSSVWKIKASDSAFAGKVLVVIKT